VLGDASALGTSIVGRNLDATANELIRSIQAIIVYEYEDRELVNLG